MIAFYIKILYKKSKTQKALQVVHFSILPIIGKKKSDSIAQQITGAQ